MSRTKISKQIAAAVARAVNQIEWADALRPVITRAVTREIYHMLPRKKRPSRYKNPEESAELFWTKVDRRGKEECWLWTAGRDSLGYGSVYFSGLQQKATRVAFFLEYGNYPKNEACHKCDNPLCVNPHHLFDGTRSENCLDMHAKGRHPGKKGPASQPSDVIKTPHIETVEVEFAD